VARALSLEENHRVTGTARDYNQDTYDRLWPQLSDFIRYNPGARHRRRHVFALLERCRFDSLLDVGCGNAELLRLIDARFPGKQLAGADLSPVVVEHNRRALPAMEFVVADIESAPPAGSYDVVVCTEVLEHLDRPAQALAHIAAAAKPGGSVIVTCPTGTLHATERYFGHVRHPAREELVAWARDADLEVQELWTWGFPTYALTKWATNLKPEAAIKAFAGDKRYGLAQIAVSTALYYANFVNLRRSPAGVQLFALFRRR
jgi:2-polyprenyl-3-methyl-5-hydroxy-6-metoxy-1,4-benzoquinol methylase